MPLVHSQTGDIGQRRMRSECPSSLLLSPQRRSAPMLQRRPRPSPILRWADMDSRVRLQHPPNLARNVHNLRLWGPKITTRTTVSTLRTRAIRMVEDTRAPRPTISTTQKEGRTHTAKVLHSIYFRLRSPLFTTYDHARPAHAYLLHLQSSI
jgi:hypothetical protein